MKFHLIINGILLLLILGLAVWTWTNVPNHQDTTPQIRALVEQVAQLDTELTRLKNTPRAVKNQDPQIISEIRNLAQRINEMENRESGIINKMTNSDQSILRLQAEIQQLAEQNKELWSTWARLEETIGPILLDQILGESWTKSSGELLSESEQVFNNPEFTKELNQRINEILEERREKQREKQRQRSAERRKQSLQRQIEVYAKKLNLNDYQKQEFGEVFKEKYTKSIKVTSQRRAGKINGDQMRVALGQIRKEYDDRLKYILSPDQYQQLKKGSRAKRK